jgi:tripartite-type tricarboxylate transporter receptor subunit TctC
MAPAGTPSDTIALLYRETAAALKQPDVQEALRRQGGEVNAGGPEQFAALIKSDLAKWKRVVSDAGVKVD